MKVRTEEEIRRDLVEAAKSTEAPDPTKPPLSDILRVNDFVQEMRKIEGDAAAIAQVVTLGPPEFVGVMLPRVEVPFRPPDAPKPLGWTMEEFAGAEVYGSVEDLDADKPLTTLIDGQKIVCHLICGWVEATVVMRDNDPYAETEGTLFQLAFCDRRNCWTSPGAINKSCLKVLKEKRSL